MHGRLFFLSLLLPLAGCASDAERLADWEQHSRAAGLAVLIYDVRGAPPKIGVGFANTGDQPITGISLHFKSYLGNPPVPGDAGWVYDISSALPAGGVAPGATLGVVWDTGLMHMGCMRIAGMRITLADGSEVKAEGDQMSAYLAPPVNGQCRNGSWYMVPDSYRQIYH